MGQRLSVWLVAPPARPAAATPQPPPTSPVPPAAAPPTPPTRPTPPTPPKPCSVKAVAIPTLWQYVIDAYIDLVCGGVLDNRAALEGYTHGERVLFGQPEQDPLGVLSTTLFFLRFHGIVDLSWKSRQTAAVALTCFHKLATSQRTLRSLRTVERVVRRFLLPREEAVVCNLHALVDRHVALELRLVWKCDMLHFAQTSPMAAVEERLWELLKAEQLVERAVIMIRAIAFFFLANALLDGDYKSNFEIYNVYELGSAVVGLAVVCARRAWHKIDHCSDLIGKHRKIAVKLLAATRRTQALRVAAYSDTTHTLSTGRSETAANLDAVAATLATAALPPPAPPRPATR